jgi:hypothetical protein
MNKSNFGFGSEAGKDLENCSAHPPSSRIDPLESVNFWGHMQVTTQSGLSHCNMDLPFAVVQLKSLP